MRTSLPLIGLFLVLAACTPEPSEPGNGASSASSSSSVAVTQTKEEVADAILDAFANEDSPAIAGLAHPEGVRFTAYTYVNATTDQELDSAEFAGIYADPTIRNWGEEQGSGFPIDKTFADYVERYVWDQDYRTAPVVEWNQPADEGSMIDNAADVYPSAEIVKYHFTGFDPQYEGMDWRSLRLVLLPVDGSWKLRGMIHDQWTP